MRLTLCALLLLSGCQCVAPDDRFYACDPSGACPDGLVCVDELCVPPSDAGELDASIPDSGSPDAGSDAGSDAGVDAGDDDAGIDAGIDAGPYVPGDLIATAIPVEWDGRNQTVISGTLEGAHDDLSTPSCFGSGVELFYSMVASTPLSATITSGNASLTLLQVSDGGTQCTPAQFPSASDGGAFLLVVEAGTPGPFSVQLTRAGAPPPTTCALADSPVTLPEDGGVLVWSASTLGIATFGNYDCNGRDYSDGLKLALRLTRPGPLRATITSPVSQALFLRNGGCGRAEDSLNCASLDGGLFAASLDAGVHWLVVGPDTAPGAPFEVRISR